MPRIVLTAAAVVATAVGVLWPVVPTLVPGSAEPPSDPVTLTGSQADYTVAPDGTLVGEETVTAAFPPGRHGLFRYWDVADAANPQVRYLPHDVSATFDGGEVDSELLWEDGRRYRVLKIGDPDAYVAEGTHTYRIGYTIDGALAPDGEGSALRWDVVPRGWEMPVASTTSTVTLPHETVSATCTTTDGSTPCRVSGEGTRTLTVTTGALAPRTGVRLVATMHATAPPQVTVPWPVRYDASLGTSVPLALGVLALTALGLVAGRAWSRTTREHAPGLPVVYEPPPGLGPVQTSYIVTESVPAKAVVATLTHLAEQGLVRLDRADDGSWTVEGAASPEQWAHVDPVARTLGASLGVRSPGRRFTADGSVEAGRTLASAAQRLGSATTSWATDADLVRRSRGARLGATLVVFAALLAGLCFTWFAGVVPTATGLPFAGFVVGGLGLLAHGAATRRTDAGRALWSRAGGFQRFLSTPSQQDRFDFSARKELYLASIPYAVAFNCADAWAEKYRTHTGSEPPSPTWLPVHAHSGGHGLAGSGDGLSSFEASLSSSVSAYEATQSSSSSSSSSGGGGGGGGGGSW